MATYISAMDEQVHEQQDERSDRQRLADAFKVLRKAGWAARMNFQCCGSCASAALHAEDQKKGVERPHIFWNRQGDDSFDWFRSGWSPKNKQPDLNHVLYLSWSGDVDYICEVLEDEGLNIVKPTNDGWCIEVWPSLVGAARNMGMYPERKES